MNPDKRREIFSRMQAANPQPTTELEYKSDFQLLIAVLLSAQTTDKAVNLATRKFFTPHGTPKGLLALGEVKLTDYIKTIGLYKNKAKNNKINNTIIIIWPPIPPLVNTLQMDKVCSVGCTSVATWLATAKLSAWRNKLIVYT